MKMRLLICCSVLAIGLIAFQNCSPAKFAKNTEVQSLNTPNPNWLRGSVCGGARSAGKSHSQSPSECLNPASADQSCNRWGCATTDAAGESQCPIGTVKIRTSDNWTYFICYNPNDISSIVGGARELGKVELRVGSNDCLTPATTDQSCDFWGRAAVTNASTGHATCGPGLMKVITSGYPIYFLCVDENLDQPIAGGGREEPKLHYGASDTCGNVPTSDSSCDRWGNAITDASGNSSCPMGYTKARTSDPINASGRYFLCLEE